MFAQHWSSKGLSKTTVGASIITNLWSQIPGPSTAIVSDTSHRTENSIGNLLGLCIGVHSSSLHLKLESAACNKLHQLPTSKNTDSNFEAKDPKT